RPRRSRPGGRPAAAASSCCPQGPARLAWPSWPSPRRPGPPWWSPPPSPCSTRGTARCSAPSTCPSAASAGARSASSRPPPRPPPAAAAAAHGGPRGPRSAVLVSDECPHLPGPPYRAAAVGTLAPSGRGLPATPERTDGQEFLLDELIGPVVYRREIRELA